MAADAYSTQPLAKPHARLGRFEAGTRNRQIPVSERRCSLQNRQREGRIAECPRNVNVIVHAGTCAGDRRPCRHFANDRHAKVARSACRVPTDERNIVSIRQRK